MQTPDTQRPSSKLLDVKHNLPFSNQPWQLNIPCIKMEVSNWEKPLFQCGLFARVCRFMSIHVMLYLHIFPKLWMWPMWPKRTLLPGQSVGQIGSPPLCDLAFPYVYRAMYGYIDRWVDAHQAGLLTILTMYHVRSFWMILQVNLFQSKLWVAGHNSSILFHLSVGILPTNAQQPMMHRFSFQGDL